MLPKNIKICFVSDCLSTGGAERVAAFLSTFFMSKGIEVHHIIVQDRIDYEYSGQLLNLGKLKINSSSVLNKLKRLIVFKKYINKNKFDYILDFRVQNHFFQELLIARFVYKKNAIYNIHSYMLNLYLPKNQYLAKLIHNKKHRIVTITEVIKHKIEADYHLKNVKKILNPIDTLAIENFSKTSLNIDFQFIIAAGRMNENKQFDLLIKCYSVSNLPEKNIKLILLGDGENRKKLEVLAFELNLSDKIIFKGQVENPYSYFAKAKFLVLSSLHEGLPMVLLECLACGTPVISFDCLSGPSEIIENEQNGLLVENQSFDKLIEAINLFYENETLYNYCKQNSKISIEKFSLENIGNQWLEYFNINQN